MKRRREYFRWKDSGWEDKIQVIYNEMKGDLELILKKCASEGLQLERHKIRKKINELIKLGNLKPLPAWTAHQVKVFFSPFPHKNHFYQC